MEHRFLFVLQSRPSGRMPCATRVPASFYFVSSGSNLPSDRGTSILFDVFGVTIIAVLVHGHISIAAIRLNLRGPSDGFSYAPNPKVPTLYQLLTVITRTQTYKPTENRLCQSIRCDGSSAEH